MQYVRSECIAFIQSELSNQIAFNGLVSFKHPISSFQFEFTVRVCVFALVFGPHQFMLSEHTVQFCSAHNVPNVRRIRCHTTHRERAFRRRQHRDSSSTLFSILYTTYPSIFWRVSTTRRASLHTNTHTGPLERTQSQKKASIAMPNGVSYNALNANLNRKEKERNAMRMCYTDTYTHICTTESLSQDVQPKISFFHFGYVLRVSLIHTTLA